MKDPTPKLQDMVDEIARLEAENAELLAGIKALGKALAMAPGFIGYEAGTAWANLRALIAKHKGEQK